MKATHQKLQEQIDQLSDNIENARLEHKSELVNLKESHQTRGDQFESSHGQEISKTSEKLIEEIELRKALAGIQQANLIVIPKFVESLLQWEAYYKSLRRQLEQHEGPLERPNPLIIS